MKYIYISVYLLLLCCPGGVTAQDNIEVSGTLNQDGEVSARQSIRLLPGFHAVSGINFHAYISDNPLVNLPPDMVVNGSDPGNGGDNPDEPYPVSGDLNYIRTWYFREAHQSMPSGGFRRTEAIQYFDGLGRLNQTIQPGYTPKGNNLVTPVEYDEFGREAKSYLPYAATGDASYIASAINDCINYYNNDGQLTGHAADSKPYAIKGFDNSPLNRVMGTTGPGQKWHTDNKKVAYKYTGNTETVTSWNAAGGTVSYPVNSLYVMEVTDENGNLTREYKDKLGQVVLKEAIDGATTHKTHYIYDDYGLLRTVVPPKATSPADKELCYYYTYDGRKRMTSKKVPGAGITYLVYDQRDRIVLIQDANMRTENADRYLFTKYDQFNRPVMTGFIAITDALDGAGGVRDKFDTYTGTMFESYQGAASAASFGYSLNSSYPSGYTVNATNILTVSWYDSYKFISDLPAVSNDFSFGSQTAPSGFVNMASSMTRGVLTGSLVKALEVPNSGLSLDNSNLISVSYLDDYGNVIKSMTNDHLGHIHVLHSRYEPITQALLETVEKHQLTGQNTLQVRQLYDYDHTGRLLSTTQTVNEQEAVVISKNTYNEVGELVSKQVHGNSSGNYLQKTDYNYNIRGWLTAINDPSLGSDNDLFGMQLYYNHVDAINSTRLPTSNKAQYNGNIAAVVYGTSGADVPVCGYGFAYDGLNRLKDAKYGEGTTLASGLDKFNEHIPEYDPNGNIVKLNRYFDSRQVDELTYTYQEKSNRLSQVTDPKGDEPNLGDYALQSAGTYDYDANGNMTIDPAKGTTIQYNYLNLPECVSFGQLGKIFYHYDAAGNKLAQTLENNASSVDKTTDYVGGMVYENGTLIQVATSEGRLVPNGSAYEYEYYLKDHLGNTRVVFGVNNGAAELRQSNNYYPFGLSYNPKTYAPSHTPYQQNKYLYNGKEIQNDGFGGVNLDWYDYGARFYDPSLGRWHCIDPLAEQGRRWSPYNYTFNNPLRYTDPDGMWPWEKKAVRQARRFAKATGGKFYKSPRGYRKRTGVAATVNISGTTAYYNIRESVREMSGTRNISSNTDDAIILQDFNEGQDYSSYFMPPTVYLANGVAVSALLSEIVAITPGLEYLISGNGIKINSDAVAENTIESIDADAQATRESDSMAKSKKGKSGEVGGKEHKKGARKSTAGKHQKGQDRKQQANRDKKRNKGNWKQR